MNLKYPVLETSESIEPNDNDFELNAISYTFSKIFQPELNNCSAPLASGIMNSDPCLRLFGSPSKANEEIEKKEHFLCLGRFHSLAVAFRNTKGVVRPKQRDQINNEARLFWKSIVKPD